MDKNLIVNYANEITEQYLSGHAREHAYRPALERMMGSFDDVTAVNDPKRSQYGNPDFVFVKKSNLNITFGYAEAKDITVNLVRSIKTEQIRRYAGYEKLFLTNYIDFKFFRNGNEYEQVSIGRIYDNKLEFDETAFSRLQDILQEFIDQSPESIRSGKRLALIMGGKARRIRDNVRIYLNNKDDERNQELEKIFKMIRELLVHDLSIEKFADMYAQTLVYGLFVARYNDKTSKYFTRIEARDLVPASNPFLREFFDHIVGPHFDTRLANIVDELCAIFEVSDVHKIVEKHLRLYEVDNEKDPIIHFYEDFLKEYDPAERKRMGAYYTPIPIVKFIVRSVDDILKRDFGLQKGLGDISRKTVTLTNQGIKTKVELHKVQILDPAVGTATFLNETIKHIYESFSGQEGRWPSYVVSDLLPRIYGFELMMAPYTIAHLKLGMTLQETGVAEFSQRLGVYLTNTLEEGEKNQIDLFTQFGLAEVVSQEANEAVKIKHERPIMVIMGNPPYSGVSSNETEYANSLVSKYKIEPGGLQKLQEKKHWLNDDYVKFIAFAEDMINKNGEGIMAMITNNGYLDNPTFRGMRWHLARTFNDIYVIDLHGNVKKQEVTPEGSKDENIFDIMQGVGIILAIKMKSNKTTSMANVYHAEFFGTRHSKFKALKREPVWKQLTLEARNVYFVPKNLEGKIEYDRGIKIDELFNFGNIGICTQRDKIAIQRSREDLLSVMQDFADLTESELKIKYHLKKDGRDWKISTAKDDVLKTGSNPRFIRQINYRIFDKRWTYYTGKTKGFISYPREKVFANERKGENYFLAISRQLAGNEYRHIFISEIAFDQCFISTLTKEGQYAFPLYIYHDDGTRSPNFKQELLNKFTKNLTISYTPENVLDYIYAALYSPKYRDKNKEFLKTDFPRVPVPETDESFIRLVNTGSQLRDLHLMSSPQLNIYMTTFPEKGSNSVEVVSFMDNQVWINSTQYFGNISETTWNFQMGSYLPAQKWLKDRKGYRLSNNDIEHYQKIIKALVETDKIMKKIDS